MFNNLLQAISRAIYNEFKDDYKVYIDEVEQGLQEPCFFIGIIESSQKQELENRRHIKNLVEIRYFPKTGKTTEINDIKSTLYKILEYIEMLDFEGKKHIIHGLEMQDVTSDKVLIFLVQYNYHITSSEEKIYMDRLKQNGGLK